MKFLKNERAFKRWVNKEFWGQSTPPDRQPQPKEYPCFAYTRVTDWGLEEDEPVYMYKSDLEQMLKQIEEETL